MLAIHRSSALSAPCDSVSTDVLAERLFEALGPLHGLDDVGVDLLRRAAAGGRFIRSADGRFPVRHELFAAALADLTGADAWVVETAACYSADIGVSRPVCVPSPRDSARALWLAAVLRLADAFAHVRGAAVPSGVFAVWTKDRLYLEFDGVALTAAELACARDRVAALELMVERRVVIGCSATRRGAA